MKRSIAGTMVGLVLGDITQETTEAVVNAANSSLRGGGGVDGAIHRAGGPLILEQCIQITREKGALPPGQAVLTAGGNLKAKYVIHTVGPIWRGGTHQEEITLRSCYQTSMQIAYKNNLKSIAFPSISTGAYGYPVELATPIAVNTVIQELNQHPHFWTAIHFVLFDAHTFQAYVHDLDNLAPTL